MSNNNILQLLIIIATACQSCENYLIIGRHFRRIINHSALFCYSEYYFVTYCHITSFPKVGSCRALFDASVERVDVGHWASYVNLTHWKCNCGP